MWFKISLSNCYAAVILSHLSLDMVKGSTGMHALVSNMFVLIIGNCYENGFLHLKNCYENTNLACSADFSILTTEFHVASLPYKPDFKVMPEGWDGITRDPDEVHYEILMKEDEELYQKLVQRMNLNKMKVMK
ncbi:hypothetical protein HAX54_030797 [Datura stramonium]|uniref:Uncharacterized protein n=1 Tax=Datura stramonium TaxID=4076 RepID=A0ABS8SBP0_DATST|nr:hypothetical protein [Datura stramonium]